MYPFAVPPHLLIHDGAPGLCVQPVRSFSPVAGDGRVEFSDLREERVRVIGFFFKKRPSLLKEESPTKNEYLTSLERLFGVLITFFLLLFKRKERAL